MSDVQAEGPSSQQVGLSPGYNIYDLGDEDLNRLLALIHLMGMSWVRVDLDWAVVERQRGQYDWSAPDRIFNAARANGLQVLPVISYTPGWANGGRGERVPPDSPKNFARFAGAAAHRYHPTGVTAWEIWNEANLVDFWQPAPDPKVYGRMLSGASDAIKASQPEAMILVSGMAGVEHTRQGGNIAAIDFLDGLYKAGYGDKFDAVSVHPYTYPALTSEHQSGNAFTRITRLRELMLAQGDGAKRIWITETGAPTGTAEGAVAAKKQAAIIADAISAARALPWTGPVMIYGGIDSGTDPSDREQNFGFLTADFEPKPALQAIIDAIRAGA